MKTVYIAVGSNLDDPVMQVREAVDRMQDIPGVSIKKTSSLYQSQPMSPKDQPDFINAVVEIETNLEAENLLNFLQRIEAAQKRVRSDDRWGPRTIDLDILLFGDEIIKTKRLRIPHPGLSQREFVVYPLSEVAANLVLPTGEKLADLKEQCPMRDMIVLPLTLSESVE